MTEPMEQQPATNSAAIPRIEELAGFAQAPLVLAGVGFVVTLLSTFLPYASVSISVFGGNLGAYESSTPSPWFLSIPVGWIAVFLALVVLVSAAVTSRTDQSPSTNRVLAAGMTGAGLIMVIVTFLELFWVSHRVKEVAGFLSDAIDVSIAIGYLGFLVGGAVLAVSGVAALVHANSKLQSTASQFGEA